jgi:tripeptide aminopeptidase
MKLIHQIADHPDVRAASTALSRELGEILETAISIQQIPSPTFAEAERARFVEERFLALGLSDVHQDALHNVFARLQGRNAADPLVVSAHTDTVFPADTDLAVRRVPGDGSKSRIYGPGLADNALGVTGLLVLADMLKRFKLDLENDLWLVANVCEEGLGDLRGMRAVVKRFGGQARYVVVEGGSFGYVFHRAIGVRRFRLEVSTPGGHSWGDFGRSSAVHVLGRLIAAIDDLPIPEGRKTTRNVGVIKGGTTINSIASSAMMLLDLRSADPELLERQVAWVENLVAEANAGSDVVVSMSQIGDRAAGEIPRDDPLVATASAALEEVGCQNIEFQGGSTDANVPISQGIPAVCVGLANSGNTHRLDEYLDPANLPAGLTQLLLITLAAGGFEPGSD